jgi:hypothetical protein
VVIQPDVPQRRTLPLRACEVAIRDTKTTHALSQGAVVTYGRVLVTERIVGMRELRDDALRDHMFATPLESRWSAPGWWIDVPQCVDDAALRIGWSVVLALPVLSMLKTSAVVPCGDTNFRRLYIIDAQPGEMALLSGCLRILRMYRRRQSRLPRHCRLTHCWPKVVSLTMNGSVV